MKNLFICFLFVCSLTPLTAQVQIGVTAGVNLAEVRFDGNGEYAPPAELANYVFYGASLSVPMAGKFNLLVDITHSRKGYKSPNPAINLTEFIGITYIDVSPAVEFRPIRFIGISLGGYFGFKLKDQVKTAEWRDIEIADFSKTNDLGVTAAVRGYFKNFFLMAGYNFGLQNVIEFEATDLNGANIGLWEGNNRVAQIAAGYRFGF